MKIYAYNPYSKSAKALAKGLGIKRVMHDKGRDVCADVLINWGASKINRANVRCGCVLNSEQSVATASNKLETFKAIQGHCPIPEFTTSRVEASKWLAEGITVVERHTLTGHSGAGIRMVNKKDERHDLSDDAKLYVKYIKKASEFRLHVFRNEVFFVQRKARNKDVPDDQVNWGVRNHANGFIYAHQDVDVPDVAKAIGIMAIKCLWLDFGAVDIIYNEHSNAYYVLEVNTACGLEGETLKKYVDIFNKHGENIAQRQ